MKTKNYLPILCMVIILFAFSQIPKTAAYAMDVTWKDYIAGGAYDTCTIIIMSDCSITEPVTITGKVTIVSNGDNVYALKRGCAGDLITIEDGATLTLENVIIDGDGVNSISDSGGTLVRVNSGGMLNMGDSVILLANQVIYLTHQALLPAQSLLPCCVDIWKRL